MTQETGLVPVETGWVMPPATIRARLTQLAQYKAMMVDGEDYGVIPGTQKPTLYQPGADTLCIAAGLRIGQPEFIERTEDWEHGFFYYLVRLPLHDDRELPAAWGIGSANSREERYAYRWVPTWKLSDEEKERAKAEGWRTEWRTSKGKRYFFYRAPNDEIYTLVNTLQKMAVKRAYVSATLRATGAHRLFTQDLEDMATGDIVNGEAREVEASPEDDAPAEPERTPSTKATGSATVRQINYLKRLLQEKGGALDWYANTYGDRPPPELSPDEASKAIDYLVKTPVEEIQASVRGVSETQANMPEEEEHAD